MKINIPSQVFFSNVNCDPRIKSDFVNTQSSTNTDALIPLKSISEAVKS